MKKLHQDVYVGLVTIILSAWGCLYGMSTIKGEAGVVPIALSIVMLAFSIYILVDGIIKTGNNAECNYTMAWSKTRISFAALLGVVIYIALFYILGYFTATFLFLVGMMLFLKAGSLKKILLISFISVACLYLIFVVMFAVNMSRIGILI